MKKTLLFLLAALALTSCQNDDTAFDAYTSGEATNGDIIYIAYNGSSVTVTGDTKGYVTTDGADVTVDTGAYTDSLLLVLTGTTSDGSLLVFRERKYGIRLDGVTIHNSNGPAINNQCGKSLYVEVVGGTGGTLSAVTTGSNDYGKPKAVKGDAGITLSGGSFYAKVSKSWACDNGTESEEPSERLTVVGSPTEASYAKREVKVVF